MNCICTEQLGENFRCLSDTDVIENVAVQVPIHKDADLRRTTDMLQSVFHS